MPATHHVHHGPPPPTARETDPDLHRWADDGGPVAELPPTFAETQWLRIASALTGRLPELAGRDDVIVACREGTRSGAPAAFFPTLAELEMDTAVFAPLPPAVIDPTRDGDEDRYPAAWGALVHEAAHAAHSRWAAPPGERGTAAAAAAALLEESRAEAAHLARRPADRPYLRATVRALVVPGLDPGAMEERWQAAHTAALVLARRDAGVLDEHECTGVEQAVTAVLGADLLSTLAGIWAQAHHLGDTDTAGMLACGWAWCAALATDPTGPAPDAPSGCSTQPPGTAGAAGGGGAVAKAAAEALGAVADEEAAQAAEQVRARTARTAKVRARARQAARDQGAARIAGKVFAAPGRPIIPDPGRPRAGAGSSPVTGTRPPRPAERQAAAALARALRGAAHRERAETVVASAVPPGRLNMRGALARDAQQAAGATPTALPFTATRRRHTPSPPLRVGIAVDVSGSMGAAAGPMASAAWIVARAAALADPESRTAAIAFDWTLTAVTAPGRAPAKVTEFTAEGIGHRLAEATDALGAALGLDRPGTGRLLVIASDGYYSDYEAAQAAGRIAALAATGCAVLWLAFAPDPEPLPGAVLVELTDPATAPAVIAKAATAAITAAR
jgi:hypothetical protein